MDAVFQATYADLKLVKTRGVLQIIFEAPVEKDNEIMTVLGGMPRAAEERWFAIARLNLGETGEAPPRATTPDGSTLQQRDRAKGAAATLPIASPRSLSQRAAISCNAPVFRVWLEQSGAKAMNNYQVAHDEVCRRIEIQSLKTLDKDEIAASRWEELWANYITWKSAARYVEAPGI